MLCIKKLAMKQVWSIFSYWDSNLKQAYYSFGTHPQTSLFSLWDSTLKHVKIGPQPPGRWEKHKKIKKMGKSTKKVHITYGLKLSQVMPFRFVYRTVDISVLSRNLYSNEIYISCSITSKSLGSSSPRWNLSRGCSRLLSSS